MFDQKNNQGGAAVDLVTRAQGEARKVVNQARAKRRRQEIELLIHNALRDVVISKKEYEAKMRLVEECAPLILNSIENPQ